MSTNDLEVTFQRWLDEPWDREYSERQRYWLAFKAGADWALAEIRKNAGFVEPSDSAGAEPK